MDGGAVAVDRIDRCNTEVQMLGCLVLAVLFWLSCFDCLVLTVLFWLSCFDCFVLTVFDCLVLTVLFWLSG